MPRQQQIQNSENLGSEFNEAIAQIQRLGELWQKCNLAVSSGFYNRWDILLERVWMELYADSSETDRKTFKDLTKVCIENRNNRSKYYQCLQNKEGFLRELQEGQSKGGKKKDDLKGL